MNDAMAMFLITTVLGAMMLPIVWSLRRCGLPGVRQWWQANLLMAASMTLICLRGQIPDALSVVVANAGLAWSLSLYHAGTARFCGRTPRWRMLAAGVAAVVIGILYWRYVLDDFNLRVVVVSIFNAALCLATGVMLLQHLPGRGEPFDASRHAEEIHAMGGSRAPWLVTASFALLFGVGHLVRGAVSAIAAFQPSLAPPTPGLSIGFLAIGALVMPALTMGAVLMIHGAIVQRLEAAANTDFLTGVLSRKAFEDIAGRTVARAAAGGPGVALLIIDVDRFKSVNDTFGHAGGDAVLTAFAATLTRLVRPGDRIGRLGGEEFAVLLPGASSGDAHHVAERIRTAVAAAPVPWGGSSIAYTVSGGHSTWTPGDTLGTLAARADAALYVAKMSGRNRVHAHEPRQPALA